MNKQQLSKNTMYKRMIQFFNNYDSVLVLFTTLYALITSFKSDNTDLDKYIDKQTPKSKGVTDAKDAAFENMIKLAVRYGRKARVWAKQNGDLGLAALLDVRKSDLAHLPEEEALSKCRLVRDAVHDNIVALATVNILPADDTALKNAVNAAETALGSPESIINLQQAGTEGITDTINTMDETLLDIDDLLIGEYEETESDMVSEYENSRKIDEVGVRHNHIRVHITDALDNSNIAGANIAVENTDKKATSDIDGIAEIIKIRSGEYFVKITADGYISQQIAVKVERGKTTSVVVKLKK